MRADFARLVRRGLREGSVRPGVSPDNEAAVIVAGIRGIGYQWLLDPDGFDRVVTLRHLSRVSDERLSDVSL